MISLYLVCTDPATKRLTATELVRTDNKWNCAVKLDSRDSSFDFNTNSELEFKFGGAACKTSFSTNSLALVVEPWPTTTSARRTTPAAASSVSTSAPSAASTRAIAVSAQTTTAAADFNTTALAEIPAPLLRPRHPRKLDLLPHQNRFHLRHHLQRRIPSLLRPRHPLFQHLLRQSHTRSLGHLHEYLRHRHNPIRQYEVVPLSCRFPPKPVLSERPHPRIHSPPRGSSSRNRSPRPRSRSRPPHPSSSRPRSRSPRSWSRSPSPGPRYHYDRRRSRYSPPPRRDRDRDWERDRDYRRPYRSPPPRRPDYPPSSRLPPRPLSPRRERERERDREREREPPPQPPTPRTRSPEKEPEPPQKLYSLPPPPEWPPPGSSEYPKDERTFKVLYDAAVDVNMASHPSFVSNYSKLPSYYRSLIDHLKKHASSEVQQKRLQTTGKGKGKESVVLYRYEGEVITTKSEEDGFMEEEPVPTDPRKLEGVKAIRQYRGYREELTQVQYEYDEHSSGPPPPTAVLFTNLSPLTSNSDLKRHLGQYGQIVSFDPQIDREKGSALGVVHVRFMTHEEARRCLEKENGRKGGLKNMQREEEWNVVFDGEGKVLQSYKILLDQARKDERKPTGPPAVGPGPGQRPRLPNGIPSTSSLPARPTGGSTPQTPIHPYSSHGPPPPKPPHLPASVPPNPMHAAQQSHSHSHSSTPNDRHSRSYHPDRDRDRGDKRSRDQRLTPLQPPSGEAPIPHALLRAKEQVLQKPATDEKGSKPDIDNARGMHVDSPSTNAREPAQPGQPSSSSLSTSATAAPAEKKPVIPEISEEEKARERERVMRELASIGKEYVHVRFPPHVNPNTLKESKIRPYFDSFGTVPDKILRNFEGAYVTFAKPGSAVRASILLATVPLLAHRVKLSHHLPPPPPPSSSI
ncbi:Setd1a protein [Coprinopsis cinerea AmutBmut pab1-1]|nr:Setd1a protein [Coprinopsis cinerea AmutBmut pab1-1]